MAPANAQKFLVRIIPHQAAHKIVDVEDPGMSLARVDITPTEHNEVEIIRIGELPRAVSRLIECKLCVRCYGSNRALVRRSDGW